MTRIQRQIFDLAVLISVEASVYATLFNIYEPLRWIPVFVSMLLLPGSAIVAWLELDDLPSAVAVIVVTSIAFDALAATVMLWAGWWHPLAFGVGLAIACSSVLVIDVVRIARSKDKSAQEPFRRHGTDVIDNRG